MFKSAHTAIRARFARAAYWVAVVGIMATMWAAWTSYPHTVIWGHRVDLIIRAFGACVAFLMAAEFKFGIPKDDRFICLEKPSWTEVLATCGFLAGIGAFVSIIVQVRMFTCPCSP